MLLLEQQRKRRKRTKRTRDKEAEEQATEEEEEEERAVPMTEKEVEEEKVFGTVQGASAKKETTKPKYYKKELENGIGEDLVKIKKRWARGRKQQR